MAALAPTQPDTERQSIPLIVGGVVMLLGAAGMHVGGFLMAVDNCFSLGPGPAPKCSDHMPAIVGLILGGVVTLAAGIPMIVVGAKRVPVNADAHAVLERKGLPAWAGAPAGRGWEWRF